MARRGDAVALSATLGTSQGAGSSAAVGPLARRRLLRFSVYGPDGAFRPEYARVSVEEGAEARFVLPSALNDPAGEYRVHVSDVLSGASAAASLRLE